MPRKTGFFKLSPHKNRNGSLSWRVSGTPSGICQKRLKKNFAVRSDAVAELQRLQDIEAGIDATEHRHRTTLTVAQVRDAEVAVLKLGDRGTLTQAATAFIADLDARAKEISLTLAQAVEKFMQEKTESGRRERTIENLDSRLNAFVTIVGSDVQIRDVTGEDIRKFVYKKGRSPVTTRNYLLAISGLFRWALRHEFVVIDPVMKVTRPKLTDRDPQTFTLDQCRAILDAALAQSPRAVAYVALGLFCAIRPGEIQRLTPDAIDLAGGAVTIGGKIAKMRARRLVDISENAAAWLERYLEPGATVGLTRKELEALREAAKVEWIADGLRHTGLTAHLAMHKDEGKTAAWGGTSPQMLHKHYRGLMDEKTAKEFWSLMPPAAEAAPGERAPGSLIDALVFKAK